MMKHIQHWGWLALSLALVSGCEASPSAAVSPSTAASPSVEVTDTQAEEAKVARVVEQLFEAFVAADCTRLDMLLGGAPRASMTKKGCQKMLQDEPLRTSQFVRIEGLKRDGRDRSAFIVTALLSNEGRRSAVTLRVKQENGHYRVVAI